MGGAFALVAVFLMLLKLWTWFVVVRVHSDIAVNSLYAVATLLMLWSYAGAMLCRPASKRPAEGLHDETERSTRYCERCDSDKGDHVHHCSVCNRCVYRMDHHCPWTNNCVAWSNKKYFLLFLIYTSISCLVFNAMVTPLVWDENFTSYESLLKFGWVMTLGVGLLLAGYFAFHLWLLKEGKTTLEFLAGRRGELAGCGFTHNVVVYFGDDKWSWWLPVAPKLNAALGTRRRDQDDQETLQLVVE